MPRTYDDLTEQHRKIITTAVRNHAADLIKEAKRLDDLGKEAMGSKLRKEAAAISREVVPIFDDQASLEIDDSDKGKGRTTAPPLLLTAGGPVE